MEAIKTLFYTLNERKKEFKILILYWCHMINEDISNDKYSLIKFNFFTNVLSLWHSNIIPVLSKRKHYEMARCSYII